MRDDPDGPAAQQFQRLGMQPGNRGAHQGGRQPFAFGAKGKMVAGNQIPGPLKDRVIPDQLPATTSTASAKITDPGAAFVKPLIQPTYALPGR